MRMRSYRDLEVWQVAMDLAVEFYGVTKGLPASERSGLTGQMNRAAASIPANIAEGHGRQYEQEFVRFLSVAYGSLAELETHVELGRRLGFVTPEQEARLLDLAGQVGRMLNGLMKALRKR